MNLNYAYYYFYLQCSRSVTFLYGSGCRSGSSVLYLWETDPDPNADPYQNLQWLLWMQKKSIFSYFFLVFIKKFKNFKIGKICLMIKITFLARKILYWNFILQPLFQSAQHFYEKWEGSRSILVTNGFGCLSGRPNKIQIPGCRSGILIIWVLDSKSLRSNKISNIYSGVG